MSERSELLKAIAAAHALRDRAVPYNYDQQLNPVTADLDEPARALASLARYAASQPGERMSDEIRRAYNLSAKVLAAPVHGVRIQLFTLSPASGLWFLQLRPRRCPRPSFEWL